MWVRKCGYGFSNRFLFNLMIFALAISISHWNTLSDNYCFASKSRSTAQMAPAHTCKLNIGASPLHSTTCARSLCHKCSVVYPKNFSSFKNDVKIGKPWAQKLMKYVYFGNDFMSHDKQPVSLNTSNSNLLLIQPKSHAQKHQSRYNFADLHTTQHKSFKDNTFHQHCESYSQPTWNLWN